MNVIIFWKLCKLILAAKTEQDTTMTFNVFDDPQQWKTLSNHQDLAQLPEPIVILDDDYDYDSDLGKIIPMYLLYYTV